MFLLKQKVEQKYKSGFGECMIILNVFKYSLLIFSNVAILEKGKGFLN